MSSTKTMETSAMPVQYRVAARLIQVGGINPTARTGPGVQESTQRHFWLGDVLPSWVPATELERLLSLGFIEVAS